MNSVKRLVVSLLAVILSVGSFSGLSLTAFADHGGQEPQKGIFTYAPHTYTEGDLTDIYYYSDEVFSKTAYEYNEHLATMSMILAASSISSQDPDADYTVKSRNLASLLEEWGFADFDVNDYYTQKPSEQTMGVGIAHKVIGEGEDAFTLLAIVPRSAGYEREWSGNFTVGKQGLHQGFATGRDIILDFAKSYVEEHGADFKEKVKVWTVGYSRGAGVANLLAAYLDDNRLALGIELHKENIFAYTFGTPSNVQYGTEQEKAALEADYGNIHNRYSDYDIVTYAPFKAWNFTYYGTTRLFDVYDAEKKARMLEFLERTNKQIYDLYTEPNSSADPDNFAAVMLDVGADLSISILPADPSYGIPNDQKSFLDDRVGFVAENLVPDRASYVDLGYEYALRRVTAFYYGLNAEQGASFFGAMAEDPLMLAAAYYCHFFADYYLNDDAEKEMVEAMNQSVLAIEQYIAALAADESVNKAAWYRYASDFIASEEYAQLKAVLWEIVADIAKLTDYEGFIRDTVKSFAVGMTAKTFEKGVSAVEMDEAEKAQWLQVLTSEEVTAPLTDFIAYLLLGTDEENPSVFDPSSKNIAYAVSFAVNAGRYMRVHNNEIILSWLRCEDSYYDNEDWHIHELRIGYDDGAHWQECACGYKKDVNPHTLGEYKQSEDGSLVRACSCGYEESHVHSLQTKYDQRGHWQECACGYKEEAKAHTLGAYKQTGDGSQTRSCSCGYSEVKPARAEQSKPETAPATGSAPLVAILGSSLCCIISALALVRLKNRRSL